MDRVNKSLSFATCGLDFPGPLYVRKNSDKYYILLITCATTRAVHLEHIKDMTTQEFLLALRRFISSIIGMDWVWILLANQIWISSTSDIFLFYQIQISSQIIQSDILQPIFQVYMKYSIFHGHTIIQKSIQILALYTSEYKLLMSKHKYLNKIWTIFIQMKCFSISAVRIMIRIKQIWHYKKLIFKSINIVCLYKYI